VIRSPAGLGVLLPLLAACASEGPATGPAVAALDGTYAGTAWVKDGPSYCGNRAGESIRMVVRRRQANIALTSNAIQGPVGRDGDLGALRWSGRDPTEKVASSGGIVGDRFALDYTHDNCVYRFEGARRQAAVPSAPGRVAPAKRRILTRFACALPRPSCYDRGRPETADAALRPAEEGQRHARRCGLAAQLA